MTSVHVIANWFDMVVPNDIVEASTLLCRPMFSLLLIHMVIFKRGGMEREMIIWRETNKMVNSFCSAIIERTKMNEEQRRRIWTSEEVSSNGKMRKEASETYLLLLLLLLLFSIHSLFSLADLTDSISLQLIGLLAVNDLMLILEWPRNYLFNIGFKELDQDPWAVWKFFLLSANDESWIFTLLYLKECFQFHVTPVFLLVE